MPAALAAAASPAPPPVLFVFAVPAATASAPPSTLAFMLAVSMTPSSLPPVVHDDMVVLSPPMPHRVHSVRGGDIHRLPPMCVGAGDRAPFT